MKNFILWLILALIWSASYGTIKIGLQGFGPITLVAGRMVIASVILLAVLRAKFLTLPMDRASLVTFLISGLLGSVIPFALISYGEAHVDSGLAAVMMGIAPVATVMFAPLLLADERITISAVVGSIIGISGLAVLVGGQALNGVGVHISGQIAILTAALCYASATLYVRRFVKMPALQMATGATLVGAILIAAAALVVEHPFETTAPSARSMMAMAYLGIMATAAANLLYFYLVPRLGAGRMSQINFLVPAFGAIIGITLMGEPFKATIAVALGLILIAVALVSVPRTTTPK